MACKLGREDLVGLLSVEGSVFLEEDNVFGVDEIVTEELCKDKSGEIFSAACRKVTARTAEDGVLDLGELAADIKVKTEVCYDTEEAGADIVITSFKFFFG